MQRRELLKTLLSLGGAAFLLPFCSNKKGDLLLTARDNIHGQHFIAGLNSNCDIRFNIPIPVRGHGLSCHQSLQHAIMFARRPGLISVAVDLHTQSIIKQLKATKQRHFMGHGCFNEKQGLLFATMNDYQKGTGKIGIWRLPDYKYIGEYYSYGIGPHDIHLLSDQKTLVVANGGIQTHPEFPRRKLNIPSMQPSLVYIDSESGQLLDKFTLPDHKLSIRHLHLTKNDDVGIALQYEGDRKSGIYLPLVALQKQGHALRLLDSKKISTQNLNHYTADLCFNEFSQTFAVTSPRADKVLFFDLSTESFISEQQQKGVSGITTLDNSPYYILTAAHGRVVIADPIECNQKLSYKEHYWDNHMINLSL